MGEHISDQKQCPKCGVQNKLSAKFCRGCGAPLAQKAPVAGRGTAIETLKNVATVGLRAAYRELFDPQPQLAGTVSGVSVSESAEVKFEPMWLVAICAWLVGLSLAFAPRVLSGFLLLITACIILLFLSWRSSGKPYISLLSWLALASAFSKGGAKVTAVSMKVRDRSGQDVEVTFIGELSGVAPSVGEQIQVWGVYEDGARTRMRAWKAQVVSAGESERTEPLRTQRLLPLIPLLLFPYLGFALLALLRLLTGS
ncbi:MAG: zinc ribbon domain-containing protein [Armatimonadota bacterium]|nr:zinc ribbon domain-containing protein [Armatimonadota bacterium]MCX7777477.1 zinc ribbon domain-containing protein [Armatimonadota bacterium]MDW8025514.1 zinc ribbon domain-containing protein [Armatimonadota bacterium]